MTTSWQEEEISPCFCAILVNLVGVFKEFGNYFKIRAQTKTA